MRLPKADIGTATPPTALATAQWYPDQLAVAGELVYWSNNAPPPNGSMARVSMAGGPPALFGAYYSDSVVAVDGGVFWQESQPIDAGKIWYLPNTSDAGTLIAGGLYNPGWMTSDGQHLYWSDYTLGIVWRSNLDGTSPLALAVGATHLIGLVVDAQYVYYVDPGTLSTTSGWYDSHDGVIAKVAK